MHASVISLALLSTSALALQGTLTNPRSYGAMLPRSNAMSKRQGYYPTSTLCNGDGTTCAEVCGSDTTECPSDDSSFLHCHSTTDGTHCCKDGTGNSCGAGDYCTNDGAGQTYCCPKDLNAADCAAAFGIDVTLIPDTETPSTVDVPSPSATDETSTPVETPADEEEEEEDESSSEAVTPTSKTTTPSETSLAPVVPTSAARSSVAAAPSRTPNATTTGPSPPQFTGGAAKVAGAGAALVVAVAGLAIL